MGVILDVKIVELNIPVETSEETYEISIEVKVKAIPELFKIISEITKHGRLVSVLNSIDVEDDDIDV